MLKGINQKISLGALGFISASMPIANVFATGAGESGTCGDKTYYVPDVENCSASCVNNKVVKNGGPDCIITYNNESLTIYKLIDTVVTWLTTIVGIIAVLMLIYGGLVYITSAGNKDRAENAKKIITYSVLGIIVVVLARVIVSLVINTAGEAI